MNTDSITHDLRELHVIGQGHEHEPLVDYALLATTFLSITGAAIATALRQNAIPRRVPLGDAVLLSLATARVSRLFTREKVTRPLRAPFTEVAADAKPGEVKEHARGRGITRAVGELLTCPRCFAMWASAAFSLGYVFSPGPTRVVAGIFSASLVSDFVNLRFARAQAAAG